VSVLITTHPGADFDGAASMVAARHLYPDAVLAFSGSSEEKVRAFFADHPEVRVLAPSQVDLREVTRLVLCDTHGASRAGHFADLARRVPVDVFDHHPPEPGDADHEGRRVIDRVGATTTLLVEALRKEGASVTAWEATLMALGVYEETGSLTFATTTARDATAAAWLIERGADLKEVRERLARELTLEELDLLDRLAHAVEVRYLDGYKVAVAAAYSERFVPEVAGIANRLLGIAAVDAVVALIQMEDKVLLVARGTRTELDLSGVARALGGGGHATAASAMVHGMTLLEAKDAAWRALDVTIAPIGRAATIMTRGPVTVDHEVPLAEVERTLTRYGINALPVMDGEHPVGVVTRETVQKALFHGMAELPVADVMDAEPYQAAPDTPLREVQAHVVELGQRFVPVVEGGRLVGCITRTDLLRVMHEDLRPRRPPADTGVGARHRNVAALVRRALPPPVCDLLMDLGREGAGAGMGVYMVGGIVRDLLLGRKNLDVDLVVEGDAIALARAWGQRAGAHVHTHDRFGTATVAVALPGLEERFKVDLATARTEFYEYPSALPTVEHSSLKKDLQRRDFTINALAVALGPSDFGVLIDYFGGQRDLKDGRIRVLHTLSLMEDPTRALRAVRFATRFGFALGAQTEHLIKSAGKLGLYGRLSGKRLSTELRHLLSDLDPVGAVEALGRLGVLAGIDPAFGDGGAARPLLMRAAEAIAWFRHQFVDRPLTAWHVHLLALGRALDAERRAALRERLDLPGGLRGTWERWDDLPERAQRELPGDPEADPVAVYRCLAGAPPEFLVHLMAAADAPKVTRAVSLHLSRLADVRPILTGRDLQELGIDPGPLYKEILEALRDARLKGDVASRDDEVRWVRAAGWCRSGCSGPSTAGSS
jgi:tRNA nucleotidyltransferase (CCA-adding enzyme)